MLALRVLNWLHDMTGYIRNVETVIDNMEVVNICGRKELNRTPLKACSRNMYMLLQMDALEIKYGRVLPVTHVKANKDEKETYR